MYFSPKVIKDYKDFAMQVIGGAQSTKRDSVILEMAPENVHISRNLDVGENWLRARKHLPHEKEPFTKLENIGMNTNNPTQGRCNEVGESLLYICKLRDTALAEIGAKENDVVSVGHLLIRTPKKVIDLTGAIWNSTNQKYGCYNSKEARDFLLLLVEHYFKSQTDDDVYKVTNYTSKIFKAANVNGIRYNSTYWKNNNDWVNVALVDQQDIEWLYTDELQINNKDNLCHEYDCSLIKRVTPSDL